MSDDNTLPNDCSESIKGNCDDAEAKNLNKLAIESVSIEKKESSKKKDGDVLIVEEISSEERRKRNILEVNDVYSDSEDERDCGNSTQPNHLSQSVSDDTGNNDRSNDANKLCIEPLSEKMKETPKNLNENAVSIEKISSEGKNTRNILEVDDVYSDSEDERGEPVPCTVTFSPLRPLKKKKSEKSPKQPKTCDTSPKKLNNLDSPRNQKTNNMTEIMKAFERGFTRELVYSVTPGSKKRTDVHYYSPNRSKKLRSLKEVEKWLKEHEIRDLSVINFTFSKKALEVEEKYEYVRNADPEKNNKNRKTKKDDVIKSEGVSEEIRDNVAKTIEKVIKSYGQDSDKADGRNYIYDSSDNPSDKQENVETKLKDVTEGIRNKSKKEMSEDGTSQEDDFRGHLHKKGKKHNTKTSDKKIRNNKKPQDKKHDLLKSKWERKQINKKSHNSKKAVNSNTECYVKLFDVIKLSSKLKNVGKLSTSMNEVSILEKEKIRKIAQKLKERKHKKLQENIEVNTLKKEDCLNNTKTSLKEEKEDEGYKWTAKQESDDSDDDLPKCSTKFENAVIIGTKSAAGSIYNIDIPSVMFLEGQIVFNEKNVKKVLKHQKKWPTHTLWILLTDISEMCATACDCFEYFEDDSCPPQSQQQEVMMLGKLDRIGSIVSQALEFAANVVPSLGEGSLLCLAPIIPSKIMCFGKKSPHTHTDLHAAVSCDQDVALFANNPYKIVEYAAELERQWLQMMQKVIKKQKHPKEILDMYIMKKGLPVQIIENPRDSKDNFPSRKIWEEFIFYILKYAGFACNMKDHCLKIADDRICKDFESDSEAANMEQKIANICKGSNDLFPKNWLDKVRKLKNVSKNGYEANTVTESEKFTETSIDHNKDFELEDPKNSKNKTILAEINSTSSEFLEPVDSDRVSNECESINKNEICDELNNDKYLTSDSDDSQNLNLKLICKDKTNCGKDKPCNKISVKDLDKIKVSEKLKENTVATLKYSEKLNSIKPIDDKSIENCKSVNSHKFNDEGMSKNTKIVIDSLCVNTNNSENIEHLEKSENNDTKDTNLLENINIETFKGNKKTLDNSDEASSAIIDQSKCIEKLSKSISSEDTSGSKSIRYSILYWNLKQETLTHQRENFPLMEVKSKMILK